MDVLILDCGNSIKGECALTNYVGKIELLSYSHGVAQQITGDQRNTKPTSGKPNHQDFTVTKYQDLASCNLINNCNTATPIPTVTITVGQNDNGNVTPTWVYCSRMLSSPPSRWEVVVAASRRRRLRSVTPPFPGPASSKR
jgi:type VI secretion system secreted protein Hcp